MPSSNKTLIVKDFSVSGESFTLHFDPELDLLKTEPQPSEDDLGRYYESDDYISHTDGKRSLFEKAYQFVKSIALKQKIKLISSLSDKGTLLDIGAGTGDFLHAAITDGWKVSGVEPSSKAVSIAEKKGLSLLENTASFGDETFDVITMWHVLEHVPDPRKQLNELNRLLKPDGAIVIAVPNFKSYDARHYGEFWAAYDVPRHLWHFSKTSISKLASLENLKVLKVLPMAFDAYYVSLLSEKYKSGKMNPVAAFRTGFLSNRSGRKTGEFSSHIYILKKQKN